MPFLFIDVTCLFERMQFPFAMGELQTIRWHRELVRSSKLQQASRVGQDMVDCWNLLPRRARCA